MDNFYRDNILDHYNNPRNFGKLDKPDVSAQDYNPFCGDRIGMGIKFKIKNLKLKIIEEIQFYGEGCAISMASASMLTEKVYDKELNDILKYKKEDVLEMLGIELTPTRLKCALLPLEVLHKALTLAKKI